MKEESKNFPPYKIVYQPGVGEYEEKKSRFIAYISPASTEEEAVNFIDSIRKKHYDARHNCPAFVIGERKELTRCSDDGEPGGTAGKPILEVLLAEGLTNTVAVVTRYFGGTLLGTGGLVRAYTEAVKAGLRNAGIATMRYGTQLLIRTDYTDYGRLQYQLAGRGIAVREPVYTDRVELTVWIPYEDTEPVMKMLTEATGARAELAVQSREYYRQILEA